jgi:hypothetical protein
LPILDYIWLEISIDFIIELLELKEYININIITDRLGKGVIADRLNNLEAEIVIK